MSRIDYTTQRREIVTADDGRLEFRGELFTGEVVETIGTELLSQTFYVDGIPHGTDREWWADGPLRSEGQLQHGSAVGVWRQWHHNGRLESEKHYDDQGNLTAVRTWDEDGNQTRAWPN